MKDASCSFADVVGFVASERQTAEDYEYLGVLVWDIKTGVKTLCVLRRLITDRCGADFSVEDFMMDKVLPSGFLARFAEHSPTLVESVSEARRLLNLPPVVPSVDALEGRYQYRDG